MSFALPGVSGISDKTDEICFNQKGGIFSPNDKPLKLVDPFTYLCSNILSTKSDVNVRINKVLTATNSLISQIK